MMIQVNIGQGNPLSLKYSKPSSRAKQEEEGIDDGSSPLTVEAVHTNVLSMMKIYIYYFNDDDDDVDVDNNKN